jgi:predicted membrane protein (TIGR00267 family)
MVLAHIIPVETGLIASLTLNLFTLFTLGVFLGKVSRENVWIHGLLMVGAGVLTALLLLALLGR